MSGPRCRRYDAARCHPSARHAPFRAQRGFCASRSAGGRLSRTTAYRRSATRLCASQSAGATRVKDGSVELGRTYPLARAHIEGLRFPKRRDGPCLGAPALPRVCGRRSAASAAQQAGQVGARAFARPPRLLWRGGRWPGGRTRGPSTGPLRRWAADDPSVPLVLHSAFSAASQLLCAMRAPRIADRVLSCFFPAFAGAW
jgi:hypothetical protein